MHLKFQDAAWYRAATLKERIATREGRQGNPQRDDQIPDAAARRLQRWRSQPPFNDTSIFAERLATDGIKEEEFVSLLSESPESLRARFGNIPSWLQVLSLAFDGHPALNTATLTVELSKQPTADFLNLFEPLLDYGLVRFREQAENLIRQFPDAPLSSATLDAIFLSGLPNRLVALSPVIRRTAAKY